MHVIELEHKLNTKMCGDRCSLISLIVPNLMVAHSINSNLPQNSAQLIRSFRMSLIARNYFINKNISNFHQNFQK